ncbi:di-heme oxidoredictase family protein [Reinekea marinisedimentorum]|uniref:CxxC motif-containing protein (DUF1111 family) n=1 Tax=Reinekea marinisedimentorum TaxID=230495 RepID=A0A4R3I9L6_9GAMM|nr:di-heme oxidoredictase family protein [Reinekea marinisedimentorum]TCS43098.1 CxxC motif-containing protein (DUF1111 family) [Reinekea marinisedimentorum]
MKYRAAFTAMLFSAPAFADLPLTGGETSTRQQGNAAFSLPASNLPLLDKVDFSVGNSFFRNPWVIAPSSTTARDGLGPLFNTNGCQSCHIQDGRGHAPESQTDNAISMLIRLSVAPESDLDIETQRLYGPLPEPIYGNQLQDLSVPGTPAEGKIETQWRYHNFAYPDGKTITLKKPEFAIRNLAYGNFHTRLQTSARIAPQMIGLGLLEQISEADILANADPEDSNQDGISGRANRVWDVRKQATALGRFGWKAGMPTLEQQNASAFNGDIGITSELFPADDCTRHQKQCLSQPNGSGAGGYELQPEVLTSVTFYTQHLAVPVQRNSQSVSVQHGYAQFEDIGCSSCHVSSFTTPKLADLPALSEQTIHPFTDLLLHDMGPGLADNREEFLANGREWRTPPLWGTGYHAEVSGKQSLLHDGRAGSVEEAILWHGGEAEQVKQRFVALPEASRQAIIDFVNSL